MGPIVLLAAEEATFDPDIASVVDTRDAVLRGVKSAIEDAGMNIPWPIRTLSLDNTLTHAASNGDGP